MRTQAPFAADPVASAGVSSNAGVRSELRTLARGGLISLGGTISHGVLGFLLVVVVTRGLRAGGAGVFFEAIALFTILSNTTELGVDTGLVRTIPRYLALDRTQDIRRVLGVALWPVVAVGMALGVGMFVFAPQLSRIFVRNAAHRDEAVLYMRLLAPFLPLQSLTTVTLAGTRGFGTMVPLFVVENFGKPALRPVLVLLSIALGLGGVAIALAWALPVALGFPFALLTLFLFLRRAEGPDRFLLGTVRCARDLASEFWRFTAPRGLAGVFQVTILWFDVLLVGGLRSTREAGIYAAASRLLLVGTFAGAALRLAIAPQLSSMLTRRDQGGARGLYQVSTWWLMSLAWPFYITVAVFSPFLMRMFGPEFVEGQTALFILCCSALIGSATGSVDTVLLMGGKSSWNFINTMVALGLNLLLNLLLIPRFGMTGAAIAWGVSLVVNNVAPLIEVWALLLLTPLGRGFPVVARGAMICYGALGFVVRHIFGMSLLSFTLFGLVATALYLELLSRYSHVLEVSVLRQAIRLRAGRASGMARAASAARA